MAGFISSFSDVLGTFSEHRYLDDGVDRLNRIYAPVILVSTASILGVVQFFGDPIECTMDNRQAPTDYVKDFIKSWCWTHGTFDNVQGKNPVHINFYQWVPVVVALQAFFFQLPYIFWSKMAVAGGMNLAHVLRGADKLCEVGMSSEEHGRDVICADACHIIDAYFKRNLILGKKSWKKKSLFNLTLAFFLAKLLYVFNIVAQLFVVNAFLQGQRANGGGMETGAASTVLHHEDAHENVIQYAVRAMKGLLFEGEWKNSWRFPMLAMCRYYSEGRLAFGCQNPELDRYGRKRCPYDGEVLCTLPLNLYNDKVFAVMTLLMIILLVANIFVVVGWMFSVFVPTTRRSLILKILVRQNMEDRAAVRRFMESYLRTDGILVIKLVRNNCGVNSTAEVVECLFKFFQKLEEKRRHVDDDADRKIHDAGHLPAPTPGQPQAQQQLQLQHQQQQQQQQRLPNLKMLPHAPSSSEQFYLPNDSQPPSIHGSLSPSSSGLRSRFPDHHHHLHHHPSLTSVDKTQPGESTSV